MLFAKIILNLIFLLGFLISNCFCIAGTQSNIDIEWIHSDEVGKIFSLPRYKWLNNNKAIIFNQNEKQVRFEILDPASGSREPLLKLKNVFKGFQNKFGFKTNIKTYWPSSFDGEGNKAIYIFDNDIFLLHLNNGQCTRITSTDVEEKCMKFSPDGKKISFVRRNDLYYYDIEKKSEIRLTFDGSETLLNGTLSWVYWEEIFGRQDLAYWWSDDSRSIAFLKTDESLLPVSYFVDIKPVHPKLIAQRYPKAGDPLPTVQVKVINIEKREDMDSLSVDKSDTLTL